MSVTVYMTSAGGVNTLTVIFVWSRYGMRTFGPSGKSLKFLLTNKRPVISLVAFITASGNLSFGPVFVKQ